MKEETQQPNHRFFLMHKISNIPVFSCFGMETLYKKCRDLNNPSAYYIEEFNRGKQVIEVEALYLVENFKIDSLPQTLKTNKK